MITEPKLEDRPAQHYVGIRTQVPMRQLKNAIPQLHREVFAWLEQQGLTPAGPPFIRYHVIDMQAELDVEMGVPVASAIPGNDRISPGILPGGRYASLIYTGVRNGIKANGALLDWGAQQGLMWDKWAAEKGDAFGSRYESFLTDPKDEPNQSKWETEVAIRLADAE